MTNKTVLMMAGLPGTGKSTLAALLAKSTGWLIVDKDLIHSALIANGLDKAQSAGAAYEAVFWLMDDFVHRQDKSAIFDSAGRQKFVFTRLQSICNASGAHVKVIQCRAAASVRDKRLQSRQSVDSQLNSNQFTDEDDVAFYAYLPTSRLIVDTTSGVESVLMKCLAYLEA